MKKIIGGTAELSEYNGKLSLIAVREFKGEYYQQWGRLELGKERKLSDKAQPFKIELGNQTEAIAFAQELLRELNADSPF